MASKGEDKGRLLFTDSLSGIERIRVEGRLLQLMLFTLIFFLLIISSIGMRLIFIDVGKSPLLVGVVSTFPVGSFLVYVGLCQFLTRPVKVYSNGVEEPFFFPFETITSIYRKHDNSEKYPIFSLELETGSTVKFHTRKSPPATNLRRVCLVRTTLSPR